VENRVISARVHHDLHAGFSFVQKTIIMEADKTRFESIWRN